VRVLYLIALLSSSRFCFHAFVCLSLACLCFLFGSVVIRLVWDDVLLYFSSVEECWLTFWPTPLYKASMYIDNVSSSRSNLLFTLYSCSLAYARSSKRYSLWHSSVLASSSYFVSISSAGSSHLNVGCENIPLFIDFGVPTIGGPRKPLK
jgi:hypothetical protein